MWWTRSYKLVILKNGDQVPVMNIGPIKYDPISYVFRRELAKSNKVFDLLEKLREIKSSQQVIKLEPEDKCDIFIESEITKVSGYFDEFEPFEIPTEEMVKLVEEWYQFLTYFEGANIPGIIPWNRKEDLIIVPKTAVKEEYLKDYPA